MTELGDYYRSRGWFLSGESDVSVPLSDVAPLLARLAKLEAVREAAEEAKRTWEDLGFDQQHWTKAAMRSLGLALAAYQEVKP